MSELITILVYAFIALLASAVGGYILSVIVKAITRFFKKNVPSPQVMAQLGSGGGVALGGQPALPWWQTASPLAIVIPFALLGVLIVAVLLPIFAFRPQGTPAPVGGQAAVPTGLAVSGDLTKIVGGLPEGNADRGKSLFSAQGCVACHSLDKGVAGVGPSIAGVFTTAATREPGVGAKEYLYESIVNPNKFIVPTFQPNLMTSTFAKTLSAQQMADLLAWMERDLK